MTHERRSPQELDAIWLELTWLQRDAKRLQGALADAGLDVEQLMATVIVNGLTARLIDVSDELRAVGSDQPSV